MKINADITSKLINIQKEKAKDNPIFDNQKFIIFSLALLTKTSSVLNTIFNELSFELNEIQSYILVLQELNLYNKEDEKILKRISKKDKKNLNEEMEEIIEHLNKLTNRKITLNQAREVRLKVLLNQGFTVKDFKAVNFYFSKTWGNDLNMKKYVRPETLYNTSFEKRLEEAKEFFSGFNLHKENIEKLCNKFNTIIDSEIYSQYKILNQDIEEELHKKLPLALQNTIIHWLEKGFDIDVMIETIEETITDWSAHHIYRNHISISKILDSKFPDRVSAVFKRKENKELFKKEINEIEKDFNNYKEIVFNTQIKNRIIQLLSTKLYSTEDFKMVNLYFYKLWYKDIKYENNITPDVLYNEKFDARLENAKNSYSEFLEIEAELKEIKKYELKLDKGKALYEIIPLNVQKGLYFALKEASMEEILSVIEFYNLPVEKILDNKFESKLERLRIQKKEKENKYKEETEIIIQDLKNYNGIETLTDNSEFKIKNLLKEYSIDDFKLVNLYYFKLWDKNGRMKQYIRASSLYNEEKFQERVADAKKAYFDFNRYKEEIEHLYLKFEDVFKKTQDIESDDLYKRIDLISLFSIVGWLDKDIDIYTIEKTIEKTILNWEKHETYRNYINIPKILDEKFLERISAVKKKEGFTMKESQKNIKKWLEKGE